MKNQKSGGRKLQRLSIQTWQKLRNLLHIVALLSSLLLLKQLVTEKSNSPMELHLSTHPLTFVICILLSKSSYLNMIYKTQKLKHKKCH